VRVGQGWVTATWITCAACQSKRPDNARRPFPSHRLPSTGEPDTDRDATFVATQEGTHTPEKHGRPGQRPRAFTGGAEGNRTPDLLNANGLGPDCNGVRVAGLPWDAVDLTWTWAALHGAAGRVALAGVDGRQTLFGIFDADPS
jgi:hypothetical protein